MVPLKFDIALEELVVLYQCKSLLLDFLSYSEIKIVGRKTLFVI